MTTVHRISAVALALTLAGVTAATASTPAPTPHWAQLQTHQLPNPAQREEGDGEDALEVADMAEQYAQQRSLPADTVSAAALIAARAAAQRMPQARARSTELTTTGMNPEPAGYTDPVWSNLGSGFQRVAGRTTSLAVSGSTMYAGAADGGVWRSTDGGRHWVSIWDHKPTLSIGTLTITTDKALWVGTGEANTNSDSYLGVGIYRSTNGGSSFSRVGGSELMNHQVFRIVDDGMGTVYAATSQGLYRHSSTSAAGAWQLILKPDPNPTGSPYATSFITDVVVRPGSGGKQVLAVLGWRNGSSYNGFYLSRTGGARGSFARITPGGAIDAGDIGRTTFAYSTKGDRLYAVVQSPEALLAGEDSVLQGVYVSATGNPAGPWRKIADADSLMKTGSALTFEGYHPGIQAWYNQFLTVDPADAKHIYVGLEEVYESRDGGATFTTISPYWNYGLACGDACPKTTHPDQHAVAIAGGKVVIGNDGGVFSRPMSKVGSGSWTSLNATLRTLQYYDAAAGKMGLGTAYWGGLQDNGTSLIKPGGTPIEPAGGDGGYVLVDPANANRAVGEYVGLLMYSTTDGGHSFTTISPVCGGYKGANCDPGARFIAPFQADVKNTNTWVAAGTKVWRTTKGWATTCSGTTCDWKPVHTFGTDGAGLSRMGTALAAHGATIYAGWIDGIASPSPTFATGIDTNYGGSWHRITSPVLPNRFVAGLTVDPANPAHVYAVYNGYSRRWIPGGGEGVVFESTNGGRTWRNISGNLPDAPGDALAIVGGNLVLGTDVGVFLATTSAPTMWRRAPGLPNSSANSVRPVPGAQAVVIGTHGRGTWRIDF
ncbi:MAG TPA: hypothetical protein PKH97_12160 [Tetrasphaera sp.]|uniref:WD40/YVTN/BNR-like repeat-containing protein n=1 Tax=Nostocoides sp. TaxID=1917966 RepID=UPI002BA0529C|nr:hypothetical protein [Tetrasphaera sp.]HNQ07924.1 hypothetical protein [Tetrasphaera sp.]